MDQKHHQLEGPENRLSLARALFKGMEMTLTAIFEETAIFL